MSRMTDILLTDLHHLISELGRDGGQIQAAIYDTAQVLRFAPPEDGLEQALDWLIDQQSADGGWGSPTAPMARDIPTLAAILALHTYRSDCPQARSAIELGLAFLNRQASQWINPLPEDIPVGIELILPTLLKEAKLAGLAVPNDMFYTNLFETGERRKRLISLSKPRAGSTASYSWEAWGDEPDPLMIDASGGIGHNPAATAAWIHAASHRPGLELERATAQAYLHKANLATGSNIPGVVPEVWPYPRNEQTVSLYMVLLAGLLEEPELQIAIQAQVADLWQGMRPEGQGISDWFSTDGDITAMVLAITTQYGYTPNAALLKRFITNGICLTYKQEMQHSLSATAHAAHALAMIGDNPHPLLDYLAAQRNADGLWTGDKWHTSWTYITGHTISAFLAANRHQDLLPVIPALLRQQHPDGKWGVTDAHDEETANVALALLDLDRHNMLNADGKAALQRTSRWMQAHYRPFVEETGQSWLGKELYRPRRIARTLYLSALLASARQGYGHEAKQQHPQIPAYSYK